ncbi:tetratricopeptide repeat protein 17 [Condylostylus longicornis]|uniref:tetratricopeptide repeat protein 17 n=1 Tax=Condylostylus longicornis TaxID=2530218 RepID=UPI00244E349C|nr:tetratricopeptide repeat protein 17 [Condylostylus longicornis]
MYKFFIAFTIIFPFVYFVNSINHWVLDENGKITQKIDSPFYLREPSNLMVFLDQMKHNDIVESIYLELLRKREEMVKEINNSIKFGLEVIDDAKCALDYYIEGSLTHAVITKSYLNRIPLKKKYDIVVGNRLPLCGQIPIKYSGICCYDHIESINKFNNLRISEEVDLYNDELEINTIQFLSNLVTGLSENPTSWKYYILSSYYWRMKGNASEAIECAKRSVMLAPRKFRDIPLLSLGSILFRAEKLHEAEILFRAAVDHAPEIAENHFALATTLAMLSQFNRSLEHFEMTEQLDLTYLPKTQYLKNFLKCIENLNKKTAEMYKNVEYIKEQVNGLKDMKNQITASHEKLLEQQVPLSVRFNNVENSNKKEELLHRGQFCSTSKKSGSEPIVRCDFYSDLQMRLESKNVDIETLEREINTNSEEIIKKLSIDFSSQLNFDKNKNKGQNTK